MDKLTVLQLKDKLQDVIDVLDNYEDTDVIETVSNTYFINSDFYAQIGRKGFVDLENIEENINVKEEDEEE